MEDQESAPVPESATVEPKKNHTVRNAILAVVAIGAGLYSYKVWSFNSTHIHTDDAYITTDVVPVSAKDPGNVLQVLVKDNQPVKAGDLLVVFDDANLITDLHQAEADLAMARAQASASGLDISITAATGNAQVAQAQGGLAQTQSEVGTARVDVESARANVASLEAATKVAIAQYSVANDTINARRAARSRALEQVKAAQSQIASAESTIRSAEADASAAQDAAIYADREAQRARTLANEGAFSQSQAEAREADASHARAVAETARQKVLAAKAALDESRSLLASAQAGAREADVLISQAKSQATAAQQSIEESRARVYQARTGVRASQESVAAAQARGFQAQGKLKESNVVTQKVAASESNHRTAEARVRQAEAAVEKAKLALDRTKIRATVNGIVSRRNVQIGQQVAAGQPLLVLLPNQTPWVVANLKETQLAQLVIGMKVHIAVDAIPGRTFEGKVDSLSQGTGSTFALLPADNATGNFTKVVQRVPVKIVLDPNQSHAQDLRAGLSSNVTIDLK